ncbi:Doublesex- And Mab-3-Related Transcription Factor 1 [Manis pentadactyla]|nr:Doublesex- And Mab-3-Related Transcription Factor 1 [Manis pentadactyla]
MTLLQSLHLAPRLSGTLGSYKHAADLEPSPRAGRLVAVGQLQLHFIILGGFGDASPKSPQRPVVGLCSRVAVTTRLQACSLSPRKQDKAEEDLPPLSAPPGENVLCHFYSGMFSQAACNIALALPRKPLPREGSVMSVFSLENQGLKSLLCTGGERSALALSSKAQHPVTGSAQFWLWEDVTCHLWARIEERQRVTLQV